MQHYAWLSRKSCKQFVGDFSDKNAQKLFVKHCVLNFNNNLK